VKADSFKPEQMVAPRDMQRDMGGVLDLLKKHGSLLVVHRSKPVAILAALSTQPSVELGPTKEEMDQAGLVQYRRTGKETPEEEQTLQWSERSALEALRSQPSVEEGGPAAESGAGL